jgi:hypothetical protein
MKAVQIKAECDQPFGVRWLDAAFRLKKANEKRRELAALQRFRHTAGRISDRLITGVNFLVLNIFSLTLLIEIGLCVREVFAVRRV